MLVFISLFEKIMLPPGLSSIFHVVPRNQRFLIARFWSSFLQKIVSNPGLGLFSLENISRVEKAEWLAGLHHGSDN